MTAPQRDGKAQSEFSEWIRGHKDLDPQVACLSVSDVDWVLSDWIIHQYKDAEAGTRAIQNMMCVEEKTFGADLTPGTPQYDTIAMLHQALMSGATNGRPRDVKVRSSYGNRVVTLRLFGWHLLQFSGAGPRDSELILWDRKKIDVDKLVQLMRFELCPFTLKPLSVTLMETGT